MAGQTTEWGEPLGELRTVDRLGRSLARQGT
jgi:hypothetical protein